MCTISTATPAATEGSPCGGEEAEQRPQPLAAGGERLSGDLLREARPCGDRARETRLDLGHVGRDARASRAPARAAAHSPRCPCAARRSSPASRRTRTSPKPQSPSSSRERLGVREALHRRGQVGVGGAAREHLAEQPGRSRSNQSEKNGRSSAARLRDLEDREPPAGAQHAAQLAQRELQVGDVAHAEADRRRVERPVGERQREHVALHPLEHVRARRVFLRARAEHCSREVEPRHLCRRPPSGRRSRDRRCRRRRRARGRRARTTDSAASRRQRTSSPAVMTRFITS